MGFDLHQDMRLLLMEIVQTVFRIGVEATDLRTFHHGGVIFIRGQHVIGSVFERVLDHLKQGFRLRFAVDNPVCVEDFVTAVF